MIDILKSPAEGRGGFVVLLDVADQLSGQVGCRSEDSASDDIALDFGKPDLDLIEPAGIGRGVMDSNRWIGLEELENILGFMCAQVVSHDVNLSALRLTGDDLASHVPTQPMRVNAEMAPDPAYARLANAQSFGQLIAAPVGRTVRRTLTRGLQDAYLGLSGTGSALTTAITRIESRQTLLLKAPLPLPDILDTTI